ncbi:MAG: VOC family protein [Candidatus Methanoperedens sp.]
MPTIVHFDLPADNPERAKKFYEKLFDWKFEKVPMPTPYYLIETADLEGNPGVRGGMGKRGLPGQQVSNYIGVPSVDDYMAKVKKLGEYHHAKNSSVGLGISCDMR